MKADNSELLKSEDFRSLYSSVVEILKTGRQKAYTAINFVMTQAYWNVGQLITDSVL